MTWIQRTASLTSSLPLYSASTTSGTAIPHHPALGRPVRTHRFSLEAVNVGDAELPFRKQPAERFP